MRKALLAAAIYWFAISKIIPALAMELKPEGINEVAVSNYELNRFISSEDIMNIRLPDSAKDIAFEISGKNALLQCIGNASELAYITTESCVYAIRLKPARIPAQTVHLGSREKPNLIPVLGNEREKLAVSLIQAAFSEGDLLEKGRVSKPSAEKKLISGIDIKEYRRYDFDEDNLFLMVYIMKLASDFKYDEFKVTEKNFLLPELCRKPLGIALSRDYLTKRDYARLFIVGR